MPTPIVAPSPTFVPPTVVAFEPAAGAATTTWDLVALGDSNVSGWGVRSDEPFTPGEAFPGVYAGMLATDMGVRVVLHSYYPAQLSNEVRTVARWAEVVRTDPAVRADLASARVVIVLIGYHDLLPALLFGRCPPWPELETCLNDLTAPMPAAFDALYDEISALIPEGALVLVNDYGIPGPVYERYSKEPFWPEFRRAAFEDWRDALEAAAVDHGFTVVHTYAQMNGPDGEPLRDPAETTSDGWHFNATGHRWIAEIVAAGDGL